MHNVVPIAPLDSLSSIYEASEATLVWEMLRHDGRVGNTNESDRYGAQRVVAVRKTGSSAERKQRVSANLSRGSTRASTALIY